MQDLETLLQEAIAYHQQDLLQEANQLYQKILKQNPRHPKTLYLKGLIAYKSGQFKLAAQLIQQAVHVKPDYIEAYGVLGEIFTQVELLSQAINAYQRAIQLNPGDYRLYLNLGICYHKSNQIEKALPLYKHSLKLSKSAEGYYNLAKAYWTLKNYTQAIEHYHLTLELKPDYLNALLNLANTYAVLKQFEPAIETYQTALNYYPHNAQLHCYLAHVLQLSEKTRPAIDAYRNAVSIEPSNSDFHTFLGNSLEIDQQWSSALNHYKFSIQYHPKRQRIPPILLNTLPKSGSIYIWSTLYDSLDLEKFYISQGTFVNDYIDPWLIQRLALGGSISQAHLFPYEQNLKLLNQYLDKWIIHVRDPRQALISWVHHVDNLFEKGVDALKTGLDLETPLPINYFNWPFESKLNWNIRHYLPTLVKWINEWLTVSETNSKIEFTLYEDFHNNPEDFFAHILKIYQIDPQLFDNSILQPKTQQVHFRKGQINEWRQILSDEQKELVKTIIPKSFYQKFNWLT